MKWEEIEQEANKLLGIKHSNQFLHIEGPISNNYQYIFHEIHISNERFEELPSLEPTSEPIKEAIQNIYQYIRNTIPQVATTHQYQIYLKLINSSSVLDLSKKINARQSTLHKLFYGTYFYKNGKRSKTKYGGLTKKIKLHLKKDPIYQKMLAELKELSNSL